MVMIENKNIEAMEKFYNKLLKDMNYELPEFAQLTDEEYQELLDTEPEDISPVNEYEVTVDIVTEETGDE